ncbi:YhcN/YlaJ family sporulation lipoprotein [Rossellomorea sp. AcN35-11]|nr:YhcN/YlaJ family sporulation lipoprotein [Rossellomorea aquimaris]WJV28471.1 YhcN/YlaJ family sporulation lipoprotein [Rossellomorea sp. AcN35-11]
MKKSLLISILGFMFFSLVTGCGMGNDMNEAGQEMNNRNLEKVNYKNNQANRDYVNHREYINDGNMREDYSLAEKEANKVASLKEVRRAYVLTTNQNAYVAAVLEEGMNGNVSNALEKKISDQVKSQNRNINNVYISTNPDFTDRMRDYANKAENGKPVEGIGEEFAEMLQRVFPDRE